jgi:hypothetical protein
MTELVPVNIVIDVNHLSQESDFVGRPKIDVNDHPMDSPCFCVRVRWTWGTARRIPVSQSDVIADSICQHGFSAVDGTLLVVAHRGRAVDPAFSFQFYGVLPGDLLVCVLKRVPDKVKSQRFIESLRTTVYPVAIVHEDLERARLREYAKLSDLSFAGWECQPGLPAVLRDLMSQIGGETEAPVDYPTVLTDAPRISESPLPHHFRRERWMGIESDRVGGQRWNQK